jgi:hypothetical protein
LLILLVGAEGFEPPTLCSQSRCATRLRYAPTFLIVSRIGSEFGLEATALLTRQENSEIAFPPISAKCAEMGETP